MGEYLGVRYVYEQLAEPEGRPAGGPARVRLSPADLASLPDDWVVDLRQAATRGRAGRVHDLITQIEPDHARLTRALRALVHNYQFRRIVALTGRTGRPDRQHNDE